MRRLPEQLRKQPVPRPYPRPRKTPVSLRRYTTEVRGLHRVFNDPKYLIYRSNTGPPQETDLPWVETDALPLTPIDTLPDGTWYISVRYFNGVLTSGFRPLGPNGETYIRLDIVGGQVVNGPPQGPRHWALETRAGGVVAVVAHYHESGALRANEWAIAYTTDGSDPPAGAPNVTKTIKTLKLAMMQHELPAQFHGTTVKVRLQMRRNDGTDAMPAWVYSGSSTIQEITADTQGPAAVERAELWRGAIDTGGQ
ncbi:MAG: hypothetical protein MI923_20430 [Phycisphaerales bacterium]|nr:hypothetical protein [Phycisphaerales bacterium]